MKNNNLFENLALENILEGLLLCDKDLNLKYINQEAQSLIGYSEKQIKKMDFKNVFGEKIFDEIILCIKNQSPKILRDIFLLDKFSNEINVHIFINPNILTNDKKIEFEYVLIQLFNLEGRNVLYKQNKFDDEEKIMSQLFHGLAHEIKNPLAGIKGAAQIINSDNVEKNEIIECSKIIESESERLSKLVNTFKYLQPSNKESFEIIDIGEVIKDSIKVCELNKKDKNILLTYETFTDSLNIKANKELLKIVFINLIKNAYDSIHIKGDITVRTKLNKKYKLNKKNFIIIEIIDNGKGINESDIKKLFKPFFTTKKSGQGIGLFISQKIINKFDGYIEAACINKETIFTVYLPEN